MHYVLGLESFVDEAGNDITYYRFGLIDEGDLEWPWNQGARFTDPPIAPIVVKVDRDDPSAGEFADYLSGPIPMVTERFRSALDDSGVDNIDYYETAVEGADDFVDFPRYFAINVIGKVQASDESLSDYEDVVEHPGARLFGKLVLRADRVSDLHCFVLAENTAMLVVSERVRSACESAGVDTLRFMPVESV